jgi:hypothetical protein
MGPVDRLLPDWRDAGAYAPLLAADRALLAWEWLRRDEVYRSAAGQGAGTAGPCVAGPGRWGLHAFEPPDAAVPGARPVWRADVHPYVLPVRAVPGAEGDDALELELLVPLCRLVEDSAGLQHLLISDGLRSIRIDVVEGSIREGRARLHYLIAGFEHAEKPLLTLRRLLALRRTGHFSGSLHSPGTRARRLVLMLRAYDALASGARQREIAAWLLDGDALRDRWRVRAPSLRSRVQRLVGCARTVAAGGYRALLAA